MGDTNLDNSLDNSRSIPTYSKGSIVLTPTNCIGRIKWINLMDSVQVASVEYLEFSGAYNVYALADLTLLAEGADKPYFDQICAEKHSYEREEYLRQSRMVEEHIKTKGTSRIATKTKGLSLTKLLSNLSPEQLAEILKELEK